MQKLQQTAASNRSRDRINISHQWVTIRPLWILLLLLNANPFMHPLLPCLLISANISNSTPPRTKLWRTIPIFWIWIFISTHYEGYINKVPDVHLIQDPNHCSLLTFSIKIHSWPLLKLTLFPPTSFSSLLDKWCRVSYYLLEKLNWLHFHMWKHALDFR